VDHDRAGIEIDCWPFQSAYLPARMPVVSSNRNRAAKRSSRTEVRNARISWVSHTWRRVRDRRDGSRQVEIDAIPQIIHREGHPCFADIHRVAALARALPAPKTCIGKRPAMIRNVRVVLFPV
jgi:hypothetical protein